MKPAIVRDDLIFRMSFKAPFEGFGTDAIHAGQEPEKWESRSVSLIILLLD